jgi:hypothetical protein
MVLGAVTSTSKWTEGRLDMDSPDALIEDIIALEEPDAVASSTSTSMASSPLTGADIGSAPQSYEAAGTPLDGCCVLSALWI